MGTLLQLQNNAKKLNQRNLTTQVFNAIRQAESKILSLNEAQLDKSNDANGNALFSKTRGRGTYSRATELITNGRKQEGDSYDLFDKGNFRSNLFLNVNSKVAIFGSTDSKSDDLVKEYGEIFGLTDENLKAVIQSDILPFLLQFIRTTLDI